MTETLDKTVWQEVIEPLAQKHFITRETGAGPREEN